MPLTPDISLRQMRFILQVQGKGGVGRIIKSVYHAYHGLP